MRLIVLKILDIFSWVFTKNQIDYEQLRSILNIKLMMDNRRHIISYNSKDQKEPKNTFIVTFLIYVVFGTFVGLVIGLYSSLIITMIVFFSYVMVMIVMTLITDFSAVLLDTSDNTIILPRPVDSRTLFAARTIHILVYLSQLAGGLSLVPIVVVGFKYGLALAVVFVIATILAVITSVFITNLLYLIIMQFTTEEKLKNIINYFQIVMAVVVMASYQLGPRLMSRMGLETESFELSHWSILAPPVWMAGLLEAIHFNTWDTFHIILAACAVIVPLAGSFLINRFLTPMFSRKLASLSVTTERQPLTKESTFRRSNFLTLCSRWLTTSHFERSAFELVYKILGRDRKIKLKIYPSFGYILVFGVLIVFNNHADFSDIKSNLSSTDFHFALIYISFMVIMTARHEIAYSDDYKASWVYFSAPLDKPGEVLSGTLKALFVKLFFPSYIVASAGVLFIWGTRTFVDIFFGVFNSFIMMLLVGMISTKTLPLSLAPNLRSQSGALARILLTWLVVGGLGFIHYILSASWPIILWGLMPIQIALIYVISKIYRSTKWDEIRS